MGVMAQYYGLPWLSFRAVTWHEHEEGQPGYSLPDILPDEGANIHPNERGHGCEPSVLSPGERSVCRPSLVADA